MIFFKQKTQEGVMAFMYLMKSAPVCLALKCSSRSSAGKAKLLLYFTVIFQRTCDFQTEVFLPHLLDSFFLFSFFKWASWFTYLPRLSFLLKSAPLLCKSFIHSTLLERQENRRWTKQKFTSVLPPLPKIKKVTLFLYYLPCRNRVQTTTMWNSMKTKL